MDSIPTRNKYVYVLQIIIPELDVSYEIYVWNALEDKKFLFYIRDIVFKKNRYLIKGSFEIITDSGVFNVFNVNFVIDS